MYHHEDVVFVGFDAKGGLLLVCSRSNARVRYTRHVLANVESRFTLVNVHQSVPQPVQDIHNQSDRQQKKNKLCESAYLSHTLT
jgi:hypothetical protein